MFIQQLYTNCLSEAAYYIESNGEAVVIDPLRDIDAYINLALERKATIKYIFETHFHADFVSGHLELAKAVQAPIVYGPEANTNFECINAKDGEVFKVGNISFEVLHTPGHTMESSCYLLKNEQGVPHAIFTGDTLFIGDVGRPDLAQQGNLTKEDLAGTLYDSLQTKILPLPNEVLVYPAHGPGSSCGKNLGPETFSTIGKQKETNYALQPQSKEDFVAAVTEGLAAPPAYFPINAAINKKGYDALSEVLAQALQPIAVEDLKNILANEEVTLLDTRPATVFTLGFIPGSTFIGLEGRFAEWAGSLLSFTQPIIIVAEAGKEKETAIRLARVGLDNIKGFVAGGFEAWQQSKAPIDLIVDIEPDELLLDMPFDEKLVVLDVRKETEYGLGHIKDAENFPLDKINDTLSIALLNSEENYYVHCAGGYRSVIALSILKQQGFHNFKNVLGGFNAIKQVEGFNIVQEETVAN
jgi:hydroxyacylglutathione hydrolase